MSKTMISRRRLLTGAGVVTGLISCGCSTALPAEVSRFSKLWPVKGPPVLRGATLVQRVRDASIDGTGGANERKYLIPHYSLADFEVLAATGANLINLSLPGIWQVEAPYARDQQMIDALLEMLNHCRAAGLYATVGFRTGPGRSEFIFHRVSAGSWFPEDLIIDEIWRNADAQMAWSEMCTEAAGLLAGRAEIAGFTPMVEPEPEMADADMNIWPQMCWQMAPKIREAAPDLPLLISPPGFANPVNLHLMGQPNVEGVVWNIHDYGPFDYTHQADGDEPQALRRDDTSVFAARLDKARKDGGELPLYVGEFGAVYWAPEYASYWLNRISGLEAAGVNWAAFRWRSSEMEYEMGDDNFTLRANVPALMASWPLNRLSPRPASGPARRQVLRPRQAGDD